MIKEFFKEEINLFSKYKRLIISLKPFWGKFIAILAFDLAFSLISVVYPYLCKPLVDQGLIKRNLRITLILGLISGGLFILSELILTLRKIFSRRYQNRLILYISRKFISHLYSLDLSFFQPAPSINHVVRASYYLSNLDSLVFEQISEFISFSLKCFLMLIICLLMNFNVTLLALIILPFILMHKIYFNKKDRFLSNKLETKQQDISVKLSDSFSKVQVIKYFGKEKRHIRYFMRNLLEKVRIINSFTMLNLIGESSGRLFSKIFIGIIFLYGLYRAQKGFITFGALSALLIYYQQIISLTREMGLRYNRLSRSLFFVERYFEVMDQSPKITIPLNPIQPKQTKGSMEFQNVKFTYEPGRPIFKNATFKIENGKWVAVAGRSGIGKTTVFNLMLRLFDPIDGVIKLDDCDIKQLDPFFLTKNIVIAPQEPILFNHSIRENITFSVDKKDEIKMAETAKLCYISDYIDSLPKGYDTVIAENGSNLSRGQKQKIVLARSIINNPPILILDEITSSLDSDTEHNIYANLKKLRAGLTTIVASHRSSTVALSDYVIFIKDYQTILVGSYNSLIEQDMQFARLFGEDVPELYLR